MILDSSFLIDIEQSKPGALEKALEIEEKGYPRRVSHIVVFELYISVGKGDQPEKNKEKIEGVLEGLDFVNVPPKIVREGGIIEGKLQSSGKGQIGVADAILAATASEYEEPIVTNDPSDFEKVPKDIEIITY